jgi:ABC-type ATPase involved in cell division
MVVLMSFLLTWMSSKELMDVWVRDGNIGDIVGYLDELISMSKAIDLYAEEQENRESVTRAFLFDSHGSSVRMSHHLQSHWTWSLRGVGAHLRNVEWMDSLMPPVSLSWLPGQSVFLVGHSHITQDLLRMLVGVKYVSSGSVHLMTSASPTSLSLFNQMNMQLWRQHIGWICHDTDTIIPEMTISETISAGTNKTWTDVVEVCHTCGAHAFIMTLPSAYDTRISSRLPPHIWKAISIARGLIRQPQLLLVEDIWSYDGGVEMVLLEGVIKMSGKCSMVMCLRDELALQEVMKGFKSDMPPVVRYVDDHYELMSMPL